MGLNLECNFKTMYLGISSSKITKKDIYLFNILLAAIKKAITRKWIKEDPPAVCEWQEIVNDVYSKEVLTLSLRQQST